MVSKSGTGPIHIALVGEFSPPHAGMAVQAELLVDRLPELGVSIKKIITNYNFEGRWSALNRVKYLRGLIRLVLFLSQCSSIVRADIVHVFSSSGTNFYLFTAVPLVISRLFGKSLIINYHGGNAESFFKNRKALLNWSLKSGSTLVVPSGFLQDIFCKFEHESVIIPNVIDTCRFRYRQRSTFPPNIMVCRNFTEVYNVACAIKAFARIQKSYPDATLTLAGDGPERENLRALVQSLSLRNVTFLGNVTNKQMSDVYTNSDIFLNTSNVDNMPNSILEAFACGLPVVSTDPGGIPYMIEHGISGLLGPVNDDKILADHLRHIVEDADYAQGLVNAGRKSLEAYTWENVGPLWIDCYHTIQGT